MQVVTDNAENCKKAGEDLAAAYPHITWSPCVAHVCDLALEDMFKLGYFSGVHAQTKVYVTFIRNHHHLLAAWRDLQMPVPAPTDAGELAKLLKTYKLQLLKPGETRFASAFLMLERVCAVKAKLQQFVVCDAWASVIRTMKPADRVGVLCVCVCVFDVCTCLLCEGGLG